MITDAALVLVACVLFTSLGLGDAIGDALHLRFRILSCVKCVTFWSCLCVLVVHGNALVPSVAVSFISSYLSLWLSLACDALTIRYNKLYERITKAESDADIPREDTARQGPAREDNPGTDALQ